MAANIVFFPFTTAHWVFHKSVLYGRTAIGAALLSPVFAYDVVTKGARAALGIQNLFDRCALLPCFGSAVFTFMVGCGAPYTGSVEPHVLSLTATGAKGCLYEKPWLHNPFNSVHALALANLGEMVGALPLMVHFDRERSRGNRVRGIITKLSTSYVAKARGCITAEATLPDIPTAEGTHTVLLETRLYNSEGATVCTVTADWQLLVGGPKKSS